MSETVYHIGISSGKDSTAVLLWMLHESGVPHESLRVSFCDTGNEIDETYDHVRMLSEKVFPIKWLYPELGFYDLARKKKRFPSARARFCTQELKMKPTKAYIDQLLIEGYEVIAVNGSRAEESPKRAVLREWGHPMESFFGIKEWRPILSWTLVDVFLIHKKYQVPLNPLYLKGAKRVGCFPCVMSRKAEIRNIATNWPERIDYLREQENSGLSFHSFFARNKVPLIHRRKEITTKKGEVMKVPTIDDVVAWSFTKDHKKSKIKRNTRCHSGLTMKPATTRGFPARLLLACVNNRLGMSSKFYKKISGIEYTDYTLNALRARVKPEYLEQLGLKPSKAGWFCEKPDPEGTCKHCWAETLNIRWGNGLAYDKANRKYIEWYLVEKYLDQILEFNETKPESVKNPGNPAMIFCHDTIDLFQPSIPDDLRDKCFDAYDQCENLVLQIQSTYPWAMAKYLSERHFTEKGPIPEQYWFGMSAGNQAWLNKYWRYLDEIGKISMGKIYIIFEPLLGSVDPTNVGWSEGDLEFSANILTGLMSVGHSTSGDEQSGVSAKVGHIICGFESGAKARPGHPDWARNLRDECTAAGVPFLFKQWGEWYPLTQEDDDGYYTKLFRSQKWPFDKHAIAWEHPPTKKWGAYGKSCGVVRIGKKKSGRLLDGKEHLEFPQVGF